MAKVLKNTKVYFNGESQVILAGAVYADDAKIVQANKGLFVFEEAKVVAKPAAKKTTKKTTKKKEVLKEELLVEAPVAVLEVEVKEEKIEEKKPTKSRKKKGLFK